ncbi:putative duf1770 domain-containing protein [Erysiphe neolycopersici]|uniref:Putative duf1770 domain-containing protein n=1 Tax=Erysiphe neolycopersici TaxID=212602 RepID=A0A420I3D2_9PEZI|nr:putative duf1770 domain-containing protein [Erysiphe neolycopersici]
MSRISVLRDTDNEEKQELKDSEERERKAPTAKTSRLITKTTPHTKTRMTGRTCSSPTISSSLPHSYSSEEEEEESFLFPQRAKSSRQKWRNHRLSPLPDLRFEQSYRNSIAGAETVGNIIAITIRDQVMVPLLQGTLWSLALLGWAHWNRVAQVSGSSLGSKFKLWWCKTNNWKFESLIDNGSNAELAACVGDVSARWNGGETWNFTD